MRTVIRVSNIDCAQCAKTIEHHFLRLENITAKVLVGPKKVIFEYDENKHQLDDILRELTKIGYNPMMDSKDIIKAKRKDVIDLGISLIFTIPLLWTMFSHIGLPNLVPNFLLNGWVQLILATPVQFIAGRRFYLATYHQIKAKNLGMDSLVVLGTTSAYLYSLYLTIVWQTSSNGHTPHLFFESSAMIITMVLVGNYFENRIKEKTSDSLQALISLGAKDARVIRRGVTMLLPVEEVLLGEVIVVLASEKIPLDGVVLSGDSYIDEKMITGEPMPAHKEISSKVVGSTLNLSSTLTIKVTAVGSDTVLSKIIKTVEETALIKPKVQRIADKISNFFVPGVIVISILTLITTIIITRDFGTGFSSAVAVLVVSCPCALGLATPMSIAVSSGIAYQNSILYRGGEFFELANKIKAIAFDKTGTLTEGNPSVVKFIGDKSTLIYTKSLEQESNHPLANAINDYEIDIKTKVVNNFSILIGRGVKGIIEDKSVLVGSINLVNELKLVNPFQTDYSNSINTGATIVFTIIDDQVANMLVIEDQLKQDIGNVIKELEKREIITHMITGDNTITARYIAQKIGITNVYAEVLPHEKANLVKEIQSKYGITAFVGDGINDAPALKMADISFAIGTGSDIAIDSADVTLIKHDLTLVLDAIDLSKATIKNIYVNFIWAFSYNIILIPFAAFGIINPMFAGVGMALSSILVVLNSLRLKFFKPKYRRKGEVN